MFENRLSLLQETKRLGKLCGITIPNSILSEFTKWIRSIGRLDDFDNSSLTTSELTKLAKHLVNYYCENVSTNQSK